MKAIAVLMAATALAACGSGQNANNNAGEVTANSDMNASASSAANPFADAEKDMNDKMMAAIGSDTGQSWARKMIEHHQGAIDMSRIVLGQNPSGDVAKMAQEAIDKQTKDIADIRKLLKEGAPDQKSADLYRPAMMDMQQHMMAATGADASEVYMRKMLEHHKGAVAMSDVALKNGVSGALRAQIQKTRADNQKDAATVEAMLSGKSMDQAKQRSGSAAAETSAATASKGMPVPGTKTPEHIVHDVNNMGNMDMNKM
ncbi:MAG: DUF305 domain-containing protein [Pseudomonadota bacterium]